MNDTLRILDMFLQQDSMSYSRIFRSIKLTVSRFGIPSNYCSKTVLPKSIYTGAPVLGTLILGTHYIVSYDAEVCGAERESSRMIQGRMH